MWTSRPCLPLPAAFHPSQPYRPGAEQEIGAGHDKDTSRSDGGGATSTSRPINGLFLAVWEEHVNAPVRHSRLYEVEHPPANCAPRRIDYGMRPTGQRPYLPRRAFLLLAGTALVGVAIALLLKTELGVSPFDAALAGAANQAGVSLGTAIIVISVLFVAVAWLLGTPSGVGTAVTFVGIGVSVDVTNLLIDALNLPSNLPLAVRIAVWSVGALLLGVAAAMLNASGLGASAYDQFVRACTRWGLSLHAARLIVDAAAVVIAVLVGGAIGIGTVGLLIAIPLALRVFYPRLRVWAGHPAGT